jgi:hypothetical protein
VQRQRPYKGAGKEGRKRKGEEATESSKTANPTRSDRYQTKAAVNKDAAGSKRKICAGKGNRNTQERKPY